MKTCPGCKVNKSESEYGVHLQKKDGLRSRCRECERKPPRQAECKACGQPWLVKSRGPLPKICPGCAPTVRWCGDCKKVKPDADFYRTSGAARGHRCRECTLIIARSDQGVRSRKAVAIRSRYGITLEEYEQLFAAADGKCESCGQTNRRRLVLDHCHETGAIRGVLCSACNSGIGLLGDTVEGLRRAIAYLERVQ